MSEACNHDCSSCKSNCDHRAPQHEPPHARSRIQKVIGVVSGKGGVGKSMVTSQLAVTMQRRGKRVAVLDADITGPSIPRVLGVHSRAMAQGDAIVPVETSTGIQLMSVNLLLDNETDPVVWRGPVIGGVVQQFWGDVLWDDVDYMFVDMPPGTGDVPLTVFQSLPLDGIIIVSTPQTLVQMVVGKAHKMADMLNIPHKNVQELGYINNKPLVFDNEPARHKLIDVIGDIALIGKPIRGRVIATRPGHKINNQLARMIRKDIKMNEVQAPVYDPNREPVMDINRIRELLPHRYPFLLVDKIIEVGGNYIVGVKNITTNEPFFQGHFPQEPVMPGVLQVEAMAQTGGLLVLNSVDEPERYSTYFMKIDGVKFRQKVVPGDTLILRLELLAPIRRGISTMKGYVFVGDKLVSEAEFMAQIVKNK